MCPIYRRFKETDISVLVELLDQLGYEHSQTSLTHNINALRKVGGEVFVAEIDGAVGCIAAILDIRLAEGIKGEIVSLVVAEAARGKGIGKGLVGIAEQWLSTQTTEIRVRANTMRNQAHAFYENMGYSRFKEQAVFIKKL